MGLVLAVEKLVAIVARNRMVNALYGRVHKSVRAEVAGQDWGAAQTAQSPQYRVPGPLHQRLYESLVDDGIDPPIQCGILRKKSRLKR